VRIWRKLKNQLQLCRRLNRCGPGRFFPATGKSSSSWRAVHHLITLGLVVLHSTVEYEQVQYEQAPRCRMHHALFWHSRCGFINRPRNAERKNPLAYGKGALALVHGNVASIYLVLVFHHEIMEAKRLDVLHIRALFFRPIAQRLTVDSTCS
jgi:hypothetical protein